MRGGAGTRGEGSPQGGASISVENTPKGNCLIYILALPTVGRLWPSDHDDEEGRVVTGDMIEALFLVEERERPVLPACYHSNHVHSLQTV